MTIRSYNWTEISSCVRSSALIITDEVMGSSTVRPVQRIGQRHWCVQLAHWLMWLSITPHPSSTVGLTGPPEATWQSVLNPITTIHQHGCINLYVHLDLNSRSDIPSWMEYLIPQKVRFPYHRLRGNLTLSCRRSAVEPDIFLLRHPIWHHIQWLQFNSRHTARTFSTGWLMFNRVSSC